VTAWLPEDASGERARALLEEVLKPRPVSSGAGAAHAAVELQTMGEAQRLRELLRQRFGDGWRLSDPARQSEAEAELLRRADQAAAACGCRRTAEPVGRGESWDGGAVVARLSYSGAATTLLKKLAEAGLDARQVSVRITVDVWAQAEPAPASVGHSEAGCVDTIKTEGSGS